MTNKPVALVDMDGTLADYDGAMQKSLEELRDKETEPDRTIGYGRHHPQHIFNRMNLIKSSGEWWENLPRLQLGFDVLEIMEAMGFYITILTQGPRMNPVAWSHKVRWCAKHVPNLDITITRNKGLVYGKVLMDDYPEYIDQWLEYRPRGLVIMPAQRWNEDYPDRNHVIRYDGTNLSEVRKALFICSGRRDGEEVSYRT